MRPLRHPMQSRTLAQLALLCQLFGLATGFAPVASFGPAFSTGSRLSLVPGLQAINGGRYSTVRAGAICTPLLKRAMGPQRGLGSFAPVLSLVVLQSGGGDGNDSGGSGGGGGGGGGGDEESDEEGDETAACREVLKANGRDSSSLPDGLANAIEAGKVNPVSLEQFLALETVPGIGQLLGFKPLRDRFLADSTFLNKLGIDIVVGAAAQFLAEYQNRKENFLKEADFVLAGMVTVVLANFAAVYSAAPSLHDAPSKSMSALGKALASCPDNAFQFAPKGSPFTILQRLGAVVKPVPQLFVVGFFAAAGGYTYTSCSIKIREWWDKRSKEAEGGKAKAKAAAEGGGAKMDPGTICKIAVAVGAYTAVSTNLRYQVVAGILEQRFLDVVFASNIGVRSMGSTVFRTANTYLGSYFIVMYLRWLGLQKVD